MNRRTFPFIIALGILLPLMSASVAAQRSDELVANIPFNFTVCRDQLPAGKYKIRPVSSANPRLLLVSTADNRGLEILCTHDVQSQKPATSGKLIFNRYGGQYFLSELWLSGEITGSEIPKTEQEQALLKQRKRERVTIKVTEVKP